MTVKGVCGKEDEIAAYQDVLIYLCKGIAVEEPCGNKERQGRSSGGIVPF